MDDLISFIKNYSDNDMLACLGLGIAVAFAYAGLFYKGLRNPEKRQEERRKESNLAS